MFQLLAGLLAFFYGLIPNYAVAIALLTLTVMLVLSPLTIKSTRSMLAMQKLQPEMKRLQQKHKGDRQKLNEEMMALYKEHKVNPAAGCLPMVLQMPVLLVMYRVIHGLIATVRVDGRLVGAPKYLDKGTDLYQDLVKSGGKMVAFGVDLSSSARVNHGSFGAALPFFVIVALVVFVQYYQSKQMTKRNTQAAANPQMQMMTRVLPAVFGLISLSIAAGVNVYFLVSGAFRIVQQAAMYRFDPTLSAHAKSHAKEIEAKAVEVKTKPLEKRRGPPKNTSGNGGEPRPKTSAAKAKGNAGRAKQKRRSKKGR
jgi:YidC/Oxa1 family membrane protein insertase